MPSEASSGRRTHRFSARPSARPQRDGRSWDKWSYIAGLRATAPEATAVVRQLTGGRGALERKPAGELRKIARLAVEEVDAPPASERLERVREFKDLSPELMLRFGKALAQLREDEVNRSVGTVEKVAAAYARRPAPTTEPAPEQQVPSGLKLDRGAFVAALPGAQVFRASERKALTAAARARATRDGMAPAPETKGLMVRAEALALRPAEQRAQPTAALAPSQLTVAELLDWALQEKVDAPTAPEALEHVRALGADTLSIQEYSVAAHARVSATKDLNHFFAERLQIEPVGLLHLERVSFIPAGIERGELVHSVPLSPDEEVNISHKEWSNTSEEFERIVTDFIEAYSEEGVTEKSELTQSTSSQIQHSSGFNLGVTASGGYGPVSISTTVGFNVADSASNSQQASRNETNEITRKASARTKKEHKMSFKVASAAGTEDQEVRKIKNPFADRATRVDYYQLIRKWRVDLYRYGIRLTYDLTIPEPGSDVLTKILQIQALQAAIQQGFNAPDSTLPWARFDLTPSQVRRDNFESLAAQYGVVVEPPPVDSYSIVKQFTHNWPNKDAAQNDEYITFTVEVPDTHQINAYGYSWQRWAWEDEDWHFDIFPNLDSWLGRWERSSWPQGRATSPRS
jgi:hypothetical protein